MNAAKDSELGARDSAHDTCPTPDPRTSALDIFCPQCSYNLRGIESEKCPECGYSLAFVKLTESQLPWLRRGEIGRVRAYWRTVRTAIVRKKKFWEEIGRPASYADAQVFRWATILIAYLPLIPLSAALLWTNPDNLFGWLWEHEPAFLIVAALTIHVCILLFFAGATGLPTYFFHPKHIPVEQQNRAVALSYYCAAPLAWAPVAYLLLSLVYFGLEWELFDTDHLAHIAAVIGCLLLAAYFCGRIVIEWLLELACLYKRTVRSDSTRYGMFLVFVPLLWLTCGFLILIFVPLVVGYVGLVVSSVW